MPLTIATGGKTLVFNPNGDVALGSGGAQGVHGAWRTSVTGAEPEDNKVRYTLDGADQPPLQAVYGFNETNQLLVTLTAADGAASAPAAFIGGIEIDDAHHLIYNLLDEAGNQLQRDITVFGGNFRIEESTSNLLMDLAGGGTLSLQGDSGINSLEAAENRVAGFNAGDLLHFHASTDNTLSDGSVMTIPAKLSFIGTWDIQNGQLVFFSKVTGDITKPDVKIAFGGKIGAITAGFVYFADSAGTQVAFNISGQHVWKAGNTTDTFNWQTSLGFSQKVFSAKANFEFDSLAKDGRHFSINGDLTLVQPIGGQLTLDFALKGQYQWNNNLLTFQADMRDVAGALSYDLMLEGTFKLDHGTIQFGVKFSNAPTGNTFTLSLNVQGDRTNLIKALSFHLQITQGQAGTMINATAEIRLRYVKGVGLLQPVTAAAA
jgi:hypothetical protein